MICSQTTIAGNSCHGLLSRQYAPGLLPVMAKSRRGLHMLPNRTPNALFRPNSYKISPGRPP